MPVKQDDDRGGARGQAAAPGAPSAEFVSLLTGHQRKLYSFILALLRNPSDADDVLQETNLVLWQKCHEFEPGTNFGAWSFRVAQFQVMAHRKRLQRSKLYFDDELVERLADEAADVFEKGHDAQRAALSGCLRKLRPDQQKLIARRYQPGASVKAMAAEIGLTPNALSESLRRIRKALQDCIERSVVRGTST